MAWCLLEYKNKKKKPLYDGFQATKKHLRWWIWTLFPHLSGVKLTNSCFLFPANSFSQLQLKLEPSTFLLLYCNLRSSFASVWHKADWMGHPMRPELTLAGLLVKLANHYTTRGAPFLLLYVPLAFRTIPCIFHSLSTKAEIFIFVFFASINQSVKFDAHYAFAIETFVFF